MSTDVYRNNRQQDIQVVQAVLRHLNVQLEGATEHMPPTQTAREEQPPPAPLKHQAAFTGANRVATASSARPGSAQLPTRGVSSAGTLRAAFPATEQEGVSGQVEEYRRRYARLEREAKAHTLVLQDGIQQSKHVLAVLKRENEHLQAQMAGRGTSALQQSNKPQADRLVEQLEKEVHTLRRQHDVIMQDKKSCVAKLAHLQDAVKQLSREAGFSGVGPAPGAGMDSKQAREMRQLENRLDKATLKANEALSIRSTYEQVLVRLTQEQLALDPHVQALMSLVKAKAADLTQAQQHHRDVQRKKETSKQELAVLEEQLAKERVQRTAQLEQQHSTAAKLGAANKALLHRQLKGSAAAGIAKGGAVLGSGQALQGAASSPHDAGAESDGTVPHIATPEQAVAALCAALQVPSCQQLQKQLLAQQRTLHGLQEMKQAAIHQVAQLETQLAAAHLVLEELQSGGRQCSTQAALDAAQAQLHEAQVQADAAKQGHDKVWRVFVDVKAGIEHLSAMVRPLPLPPGHIPVPLTDDTLGDVLAQCQQRLVSCQAFIHTIPKAAELLDSMMHNPDLCFSLTPEGSSTAGL